MTFRFSFLSLRLPLKSFSQQEINGSHVFGRIMDLGSKTYKEPNWTLKYLRLLYLERGENWVSSIQECFMMLYLKDHRCCLILSVRVFKLVWFLNLKVPSNENYGGSKCYLVDRCFFNNEPLIFLILKLQGTCSSNHTKSISAFWFKIMSLIMNYVAPATNSLWPAIPL